MRRWAAAAAGMILVGAVGLARRAPAPAEISGRTPAAVVADLAPPAGEIRVDPADLFWEEVRGRSRTDVVARTALHLGWDEERRSGLASMADGVANSLRTAWAVRDSEVLALPADLDPEERERRALEAQLRYEESKRQTLSRLAELFDPSRHREQELLDSLEEWVDAVRE